MPRSELHSDGLTEVPHLEPGTGSRPEYNMAHLSMFSNRSSVWAVQDGQARRRLHESQKRLRVKKTREGKGRKWEDFMRDGD